MKNKLIISYFSLLVVLFPILNRYSAPFISFLTLSEFLLIPIFIYFLFDSRLKKISWGLIIFSIFILINLIINSFSSLDLYDLIGTNFRLIYLYVSIGLFSKNYFNLRKAFKYLNFFSLLISGYAVLQFLFSYYGIYLTTYLPLLSVIGKTNIDNEILEQVFFGIQFRSRSFLNEPAHLATYLILPLSLSLIYDSKRFPTILFLFYSFGIIVSLSLTGILTFFLILLIFLTKRFNFERYTALFLFSGSIFLALFFSGTIFSLITLLSGKSINNLEELIQSTTRFYQLFEVDYFPTLFKFLFGQGLYELDVYLPTYFQILFSFGFIGILIFFIYFIRLYKLSNLIGKTLIFVFIFLNIGTEILLGNFALFFLVFIDQYNYKIKLNSQL
jgi:hypothetical protein